LGLSQYVETFREEGFESWDIVLDITESDLEALGVKLGHRRVLQREIAQTRGLSVEQLNSAGGSGSQDDRQRQGGEESRTDGQGSTGGGQKRKYRRHPKSDENAPERPPSAYVIFSNKIREELKPETLSFTAIAKRVGERWQEISAEEKEPYESGAAAAKEKYHAQMTEYKTTKAYRDYQQYLAEFEAKHAS
ncbi:high mobility group box domain-containing protein, partial [Usnea florida]